MPMTHEEAARILDTETSREALDEIEYYGGFRGDEAVLEAVNEACRIAADALRNKPTGEALTLEQLREMDGQPVWVERNEEPYDGKWFIVDHADVENPDKTLYTKEGVTYSDYGKYFTAYAYPPAHIDLLSRAEAAEARAEKAERERDVAVNDLKEEVMGKIWACDYCKKNDPEDFQCKRDDLCGCSEWEWRGQKEV